jgi:hypothetical protein
MSNLDTFDTWYEQESVNNNEKIFNIIGMEARFRDFLDKTKLRVAFNFIGRALKHKNLQIMIAGGIFSCFVNNIPVTDIDVYSNADSFETFKTVVNIMHEKLLDYFDVSLILRKNAINFNITTRDEIPVTYTIQLITTSYSSAEHLVDNFDINVVQVVYIPVKEDIYYTEEAFNGFYDLKVNVINKCRSSKYRIYKFINRGFEFEKYNYVERLPYLIHTSKNTISVAMQFMPITIEELNEIFKTNQLYFKVNVDNIDVYVNCNVSFKYPSKTRGICRLTSNVLTLPQSEETF